MNVSACLVTRGDVPMDPIINSLTSAGIDDIVVWDNSERANLAVYGRYAAIDDAKHELIYVQDDDVVLDPETVAALIEAWAVSAWAQGDYLVSNMPERFRHDFYEEHALVGFGAVFNRRAPAKAILKYVEFCRTSEPHRQESLADGDAWHSWFLRTADVVFTALTPRILVDLPYADREFASAPNRMWRQPDHIAERTRMLELVRHVRDREAA